MTRGSDRRLSLARRPLAFAQLEIVLGSEGQPVDFLFLQVNPLFEALTGLTRERAVGNRVTDVLPAEDCSHILPLLGRTILEGGAARFVLSSEGLQHSFEILACAQGGHRFTVFLNPVARRVQGEPATYFSPLSTGQDVWVRADPEVAATLVGGGFTVAEELIRAREDLVGFPPDRCLREMLEETLRKACRATNSSLGVYRLYGGTVARSVKARDDSLFLGHGNIHRQFVSTVVRDGRIVAALAVANKPEKYSSQDSRTLGYLADVAWSMAEGRHLKQSLRFMETRDGLTGVHNRAHLVDEMHRLDLEGQLPLSIVVADINGLGLINDAYGNYVGDELLKMVAGILVNSCKAGDIVGRWGSDEFVLLLPGASEEQAKLLCKHIRSKCHGVYVKDAPVALALGYSTKTSPGETSEEVLREAEDVMYKQKLTDTRSSKNAVLNAFLKTLEMKSFETSEHACRMQVIALRFGERLGLSDDELSRLSLLVTLHDIGKITIPSEMLTKPGPLTSEEWEIMRKHPETGYRIARSTQEFAHVAPDILAHHERWDGTGYPNGLKKEEIPLLARITSIIDAFEVMTSGRPYKKAMSLDEAAREIARCSGTQFDPQLSSLFLSMLRDEKNLGA